MKRKSTKSPPGATVAQTPCVLVTAASVSPEKTYNRQTLLVLLVILLSGHLFASLPPTTVLFAPQDNVSIKGVTEWAVEVCAPEARNISSGQLYRAAATHFAPLTAKAVQRKVRLQDRRSPARIALLIIEGLAWAVTAAQASQAVKIADKWRALAPAIAGGLRLATVMIDRERPKPEPIPTLPATLAVPAGGCVEVTMWSKTTTGEAVFVEVIQ